MILNYKLLEMAGTAAVALIVCLSMPTRKANTGAYSATLDSLQNEIAQQRCNNMAKTAAIKDLNKTIMQSKTRPQRVYPDPGIKSTFYQKK